MPARTVEIDWVDPSAGVAGLVRVEPTGLGPTALLVAVLVAGDDPVVLLDHELPRPRRGLELRSTGVWIEIATLEPGRSWQVGLEAFALRVDPDDVVSPATHGERVPLGLDLAVTAGGEHGAEGTGVGVEGEVLVGPDTIEVAGRGLHRTTGSAPHRGDPVVADLAVSWPNAAGALRRRLVAGRDGQMWVTGPDQSMSASV